MQVKTDKISGEALGTGRRKTSVARVRLRAGNGNITINQRPLEEYFPADQHRKAVLDVLDAVGRRGQVDVTVRVSGGGLTGQADACRMGLARALCSLSTECFPPLRDGGFLTRDSRMKERKKYGLHGARRGTQFSKR
jgi:small subunit ribosomal protein S9